MQLAKQGLNIILVSRSLSKLETVAKEIQKEFGVQTAVIDVDFTSGDEIYDKVKKEIIGKEIGILVNNVGMYVDNANRFLSLPNREKLTKDIISCNITSLPMMCSIVMPQMVERKKGIVINLSSISAVLPPANISIYAASKSFVDRFSGDLAAEYGSDGIIVQSVLPGLVASNMSKLKPSLLVPSAEQYVESALRTVGYARHTMGLLSHQSQGVISSFLNMISPSLCRNIVLSLVEYMEKNWRTV